MSLVIVGFYFFHFFFFEIQKRKRKRKNELRILKNCFPTTTNNNKQQTTNNRVGKSSLLRRNLENKFDEREPVTLGVAFREKEIKLNEEEMMYLQVCQLLLQY